MTLNELKYGDTQEVAMWLDYSNSTTTEQIAAALVNALRRIAALEKRLTASQSA